MSKYEELYDIVIIGGGLGGLESACILSKEGYKVCVLDRNKQIGGNLQTFVRDKQIFDTGVHYFGGLEEGQNLHQIFSYLGIMPNLRLKKMDESGYDQISFDNDSKIYQFAQGHDRFIDVLSQNFPNELDVLKQFVAGLQAACSNAPMYHLDTSRDYSLFNTFQETGARDFIYGLTSNPALRGVLSGNNILFGGNAQRTPFYVMALSMNTYIESSWKCIDGGSQIAKYLVQRIRENGGDIFRHSEVVELSPGKNGVRSARLENGAEIFGKTFISNIHPANTLDLMKNVEIRKSYRKRIENIPESTALFTVYLVLEEGKVPYLNHNIYHHKRYELWDEVIDYSEEEWPISMMISCPATSYSELTGYTQSLSIMAHMKYDEVQKWDSTFNSVAKEGERGEDYEAFKQSKAETIIKALEQRLPGVKSAIKSVYTSSPLSYRDYIGNKTGSAYGIERDFHAPWKSIIGPRSKIPNLLYTGQNLTMHGILGVSISSILTCSELLGKEYLVNKIKHV